MKTDELIVLIHLGPERGGLIFEILCIWLDLDFLILKDPEIDR